MKRCALLFLLLSGSVIVAQVPARTPDTIAPQQLTKAQAIQRGCRASEITNGPELTEVQRILRRIGIVENQDKQHNVYFALVDSSVINAWTINNPTNMPDSLVCLPVAMVHFMGDAEGEPAFIMSHEIGHAVDDQCKTRSGRDEEAGTSSSVGAIFGGVLGGGKGAAEASSAAVQRSCESRADEIGFSLFTRSGYNPYDAAGAFGRIEMYLGDTKTGISARFAAMGQNHPMTPARVDHMRTLLINFPTQGRNRPIASLVCNVMLQCIT